MLLSSMHWRRKTFFLCFLLIVDLLISFTVVKVQTVLRVGVETNYPPFSVLSEDGSPTGFDPVHSGGIVPRYAADM